MVEELSAHFHVVAIDWPGYGGSPTPSPERFSGALSYRDVLIELIDDLASRQAMGPVVLVGSSVGGFAALCGARARPDLVAGLVLVAPGGFTSQNPVTRLGCRILGTPSIARRAAFPLARLYLRRRNAVTKNALGEARDVGRSDAKRMVFASVWRSFLEPAHDLRRLPPMTTPTLLTWGRWDPVLPSFTDGRTAAKVLGAELHRFSSGHEPYAETPDAWLKLVLAFLATIPISTGRWSITPHPDAT